jgi:hypothetical protein
MTRPKFNIVRAAVVMLLGIALSACLLAPGRFTSDLDIRKDGRFTFTFAGEIHMLALSKLAQMGKADENFKAKPCYGDGDGEERPCTTEEIAQQQKDWDAEQKQAAQTRKREAESMKAMFGGIDFSDPRAAEELAARLRRQSGWRKVEYKGDGLFDVDFAISGRLDHDFIFPTIERFPMANSFVLIAVRQDGTVRVDATGFGPAASGEPYRGLVQLGAMSDDKADTEGLPRIDGTFTIRTDGAILANNTDEGPKLDATGQKLAWKVNLRTPAAPMALIRLTP